MHDFLHHLKSKVNMSEHETTGKMYLRASNLSVTPLLMKKQPVSMIETFLTML